jgi:small subunit ribosomal protein S16
VAVKIRLKRMGKIRAPHYRIVVVDSRKKRDGKVIEEIGLYHPKEEPSYISVASERAQYWLGVGAQPSEAVAKLLKITGDWQKFKGYAGADGTLRVAESKRDKLEVFNEALKDSANEPKAEAVTRRATKKAAKKAGAEDKTAAKSDDKADAPAEAKADAPAEAPAAEAAAVEAEAPAPVPADETPEGAADAAETAETAEADADAKSDEA